MIRPAGKDRVAATTGPATTGGTIAVVNLHVQIDGLAARVLRAAPRPSAPWPAAPPLTAADWLLLIDLLILRGHVLGRIADYERAAELAVQFVHDTTDDGTAFLARARTRAAFHRFADALADLDAAELGGVEHATLEAERAVILQATGCYVQAEELHRAAARRKPGFATLGALAVLHAERGEVAEAEAMFAGARHRYQGISPFPLASLDFRHGLMWYREGNLPAARTWLDVSGRRVPAYAPALGLLAEIDTAAGAYEAAVGRLRPLASSSDDPGYAAKLACVLDAAAHREEAEQYRSTAAVRYDELALCHPEAFGSHAADFREACGLAPARPRPRSDRQHALD